MDVTAELDKVDRVLELEAKVAYHNMKYWEDNEPEISDEDYDLLVSELKLIAPESQLFDKIDEQKSVESQDKYVHSDPMLSLEKFYSKKEVIDWMKKIARDFNELFKFELKLDGISGRLENGILATRGDGRVGENHADKIPYIEMSISSEKSYCKNNDCRVDGELIITDSFFEENLKGEFKNSRNAVAGLMGRKRPEEIKGKGVTFVDFDWDDIGFEGNIDAIEEGWDGMVKALTSKGLPYDGIVVKLADIDYYKQLGNKTKSPKGAVAYKFANKSGMTPTKGITGQVSRNGRITPVAELEPIELAGVTISRATCHNFKFVEDMGIGIGSTVIIERAGDVIPKITGVVDGRIDEVELPTHCPCCEWPTERRGVDLFCTNENCPDRIIENIVFMAKTIGIDELGRPTAEKLSREVDIRNVYDFGRIPYDVIYSLEGYGEKSADTLRNNINNALHNINEIKFLASFGIEGVGRTVINKLLTCAGNIPTLFKATKDELMDIDGVGEKLADNFINAVKAQKIFYVYEDYRIDLTLPLQEHNNVADEQEDVKTICFTGKMPEGRKHYEAIATERGLKPSSSVNKDLDILVISEAGWTSGKVKKAEKYGTEIIPLENWI